LGGNPGKIPEKFFFHAPVLAPVSFLGWKSWKNSGKIFSAGWLCPFWRKIPEKFPEKKIPGKIREGKRVFRGVW